MKRFPTALIFPCLCAGILAWFHWNAIEGPRGKRQLERTEGLIVQARRELDALTARRTRLSHKVSLLRPQELDPDLLGVQARRMLHYSHPDELIVYMPEETARKDVSETPALER